MTEMSTWTGPDRDLPDTVVVITAELHDLAFYHDDLPGTARGDTDSLPEVNAVYLLWRGQELLYVGCTTGLRQRMHHHARKPYDYMTWMTFGTSGEARYWEGELIRAYLPDLNTDLGVNAMAAIRRGELADRLMPLPEASKLLAVHPRTMKRRFAARHIPTAAIFKTPFPLLRWYVRRQWVEAQMAEPTASTN